MPKTTDYHEKLRPYVHHGVDIPNDPKQAAGECPFCGKPRHFSVETETGQFRCLVCEEAGNIYTFLQQLHAKSLDSTPADAYELLAEQRTTTGEALRVLGVARSIITGEWLVPSYNTKGALANLTRMVPTKKDDGGIGFLPLATPGCKQWLFGLDVFLKSPKPTVYIAEGFWDLAALYGVFSQHRMANGKLIKSSDPAKAILATTGVIAVPGAGNFQADWFEPLTGRDLLVAFDNDHPLLDQETQKPKIRNGNFIRPGWDGMQRVAALANQQSKFRPKSLSILHWNHPEPGHNPGLASGYDLRDVIKHSALEELLGCFVPVAFTPMVSPPKNGAAEPTVPSVTPIERHTFEELWKDYEATLHCTQAMRYTLAVMLATVTSTKFPPEGQLFLRVRGPAGSGKTTLAEAISAAREYVSPKSVLTGFHSGFIDYGPDGEPRKDASLLNRMNGKCVIMKDADTLLSSANSGRIMSELRDIFDGTSRSEYRNKAGDDFENLNITFILCGTRSLLQMDSTHLGARFLDIEIMKDGEDHKPYLSRASTNAYSSMVEFMKARSRPAGESDDPLPASKSYFLKQVTYGFIKYFEEHFNELRPPEISPAVQSRIEAMAQLVAFMRARVERSGRSDDILYRHAIEVPTRLAQQLTRLPFCLALILGKQTIDDEVLDITRKVMIDTSVGFQYEIAEQLADPANKQGMSALQLSRALSLSESTIRRVADDMLELDILQPFSTSNNSGQRGRNSHLLQFTPVMREVWNLAMGIQPLKKSVSPKPATSNGKPVAKRPTPKKGISHARSKS